MKICSLNSRTDDVESKLTYTSYVSDVFEFADSCDNGLTFFATGTNSTNIPSASVTWRYASGLVLKRTTEGITVLLFGYATAQFAVVTKSSSGWSEWTIK